MSTMRPQDMPIAIHWFEDPNAIAHAMSLPIQFPEIENGDPAYWDQFNRAQWRRGLVGKVDMSARELATEDPDWVRLKNLGVGAELWFDMEEGIVFRCPLGSISDVVTHIRDCAARGQLALWQGDLCRVVASSTVAGGDLPDEDALAPYFAQAGFRWNGRCWQLGSQNGN